MNEPQKRYKIILERPNCIGTGSCVVTFPERWVLNKEDDKADLIGGARAGENIILECTEEELDKFLESAQVCPVNVIHIIEIETGKKII